MNDAPVEVVTAPVPPVVLCVDDEPNILSSLRRLLRGSGYKVLVAEGGAAGLQVLESESVDLVVSDMRMPEMDGAKFLQQVRQRWPDTVRILLTGYSDIHSVVEAVNRGEIYRYITKPWDDQDIVLQIRLGLERRALEQEKRRLEALTRSQNEQLQAFNASLEAQVAERSAALRQSNERLKKNFLTLVKTFSNFIGLRDATQAGHGQRVANLARRVAEALKMDEVAARDTFIAALLHDVGHIGLSDAVLGQPVHKLGDTDLAAYRMHPEYGQQALMGLDDMQGVATLVRSHHERFDGSGFPDGLKGEDIPLGARILSLIDAYDELLAGRTVGQTLTQEQACHLVLHRQGHQFDPRVVEAFLGALKGPPPEKLWMLATAELKPGMVLARDFVSPEGIVLLSADHALSTELIQRIRNFETRRGLTLTLAVKPTPSQPTEETRP
jgi:response regulator RpfG family c-di-GMP phosphodiesterase